MFTVIYVTLRKLKESPIANKYGLKAVSYTHLDVYKRQVQLHATYFVEIVNGTPDMIEVEKGES